MAIDAFPTYENIRLETKGELTWIVLNRPDKANSLSKGLLDDFSDALERLKTSGGKVIAIRGEGKGFSGGYDIGQVANPSAHGNPVADMERLKRNVERYIAIWDHPKPVIAAVHGFCFAGATQICVFADITVVTNDAQIGEPKLPIGGGYVAPLWVPLVGAKRAKELAFVAGNWIDGPTAVQWGWANHSVEPDQLIPAVESLAERIAKMPSDILRVKKLSINRAAEAAGYRASATSGPELDALLHLTESVHELRAFIGQVGIKEAVKAYSVPPTTPLRAE